MFFNHLTIISGGPTTCQALGGKTSLKIKQETGPAAAVQWLRLHLPTYGTQVQPLVEKLRSHMLWGMTENLKNKIKIKN